MRSPRSVVVILILSCGLTAWPTPGRTQGRADSAVAPDGSRTPVGVGVILPATADFWSIRIQPTDSPALQAQEIDMNAAVRRALDNRTDLHALDDNIESTDTNIRYYDNQRLPDVTL